MKNAIYMTKKQNFIEKAIKIHGDKYDYSKVEYNHSKEKVCIICPIHGEFWQTPDSHLQGCGCPQCANKKRWDKRPKMTTEEFIKKAKEIHGDKYDYSKTKYVDSSTKLCIICPKHGEFYQLPNLHIGKYNKHGCPKCKFEKLSKRQLLSDDEVFKKAREIHGDKYDYSESIYSGKHHKMKIHCNVCGKDFFQEPNSHLSGKGCPHCSNRLLNTNEIVRMFKEVHGDKYDYSKVNYKTMRTKVCIICPIHGEFWQTPEKHLKRKQGCPSCKESHLEEEIRLLLTENNIQFEYDKTKTWLGKQRLDFYLPKYNVAIECQGIQHFKPSAFSNKMDAKENFDKLRTLDKLKLEKCKENNVKVIYYTDLNYKSFLGEKILKDKEKLIKELLSEKSCFL